ncbi:MAG: hypothetical protein N2449_04480 [Bacteroidales bacterium]|nr:hypothetical protein [Bacteroidales bacterium]
MEEREMSIENLHKELLETLPYKQPFLFIDRIIYIDEQKVKASYFFHENHDFYKGHFSHKPLTPGAILLECMGQVGCVLHGIYLFNLHKSKKKFEPILGLVESNYFYPVFPNTLVYVESELDYIKKTNIASINHLYDDMNNLVAISRIQCAFSIYES